jgi:hypothetical protein
MTVVNTGVSNARHFLENTLIPDASNAELKDLLTTGLKIFQAMSSMRSMSPNP